MVTEINDKAAPGAFVIDDAPLRPGERIDAGLVTFENFWSSRCKKWSELGNPFPCMLIYIIIVGDMYVYLYM